MPQFALTYPRELSVLFVAESAGLPMPVRLAAAHSVLVLIGRQGILAEDAIGLPLDEQQTGTQ